MLEHRSHLFRIGLEARVAVYCRHASTLPCELLKIPARFFVDQLDKHKRVPMAEPTSAAQDLLKSLALEER